MGSAPATSTPTPTRVRFHVDQPAGWVFDSRCLIMRGWAFADQGPPLRAIRLGVGDRVLHGTLGFPRPDVLQALPAAPGSGVGFEIRGVLPTGRVRLELSAQLADGTWQALTERETRIPVRLRPLWLGGNVTELMFFQMPGHAQYAPRPLCPEKLPRPRSQPTQRPALTIVTPAYQHRQFLPETVQSVLGQPNAEITYVVQDGGSTDGSAEWMRQCESTHPARANVRLLGWESAPDRGQADAIARGFAKTSGAPADLMAWINSDDFYLPGALAFVVDFFARHPEVDVVYGHRILVDESSREIGRWFLPAHDPAVLRLNDFVPQETLFWRRRVWDRVGGIDPSFRFAMDWDLLLRFQAAGAKIVRLPRFLACFRIHAAQKTTAQMHSVGQEEITRLREQTFARPFPPVELETHPILLRYLRRSAWLEFLWRCGIRAG